ncbi:NAD-dependent epimerase/dehydratase family protein [Streptomyces sp. NPDC051555]|uniref:NAD-dependent epimerase/dehydratase family protein n=1 Tax=Streptomyces sp. NPDC051555 TaxID=3365657 RepID=UPI0037AC9C37
MRDGHMKVVVTGATGYLGLGVVKALASAGHEVVALARTGRSDWPVGVHARKMDLADGDGLRSALRGADAVCHLAALMRVRTPHAVGDYYRTNVTGTVDLLDAMVAERAGTGRPMRIVFLSSAAVYGPGQGRPLRESDATRPTGVYGRTKLAAEHAITSYAEVGAVDAVTLRLFNAAGVTPAGRAPDGGSLIARALDCAAHAGTVRVHGDGSAIRDFVHVADVVDAVGLALGAVAEGPVRTYNIGAVPASVTEIIDTAQRVSGRTIAVDHHPAHPNETPYSVADTTAARERLGWAPRYTELEPMIGDHWRRVHAERTTEAGA